METAGLIWRGILVFVAGFGTMAVSGAESLDEAGRQKVVQAFEAVNRRFDEVSSLQYRVERKTVSQGVTLVEKWTLAYATQGLVRIDYLAPEKRVFATDGQVFTEYLPAARAALRTPADGNGQEAQTRMAAVLQRLSVDGLRIGDYEGLLNHLVRAETSAAKPALLTVEGTDPRYRLQIDTDRRLLLGFEKWGSRGRLIQSIQPSGFVEPKPGFWLPTRIKTVFLDGNRLAERETTLSGIRVEEPLAEKTMDLTLPDDVKTTMLE